MKKMFLIALLGAVVGLTGCNTIAGAGKDVQRAGQGIEDASHDARN